MLKERQQIHGGAASKGMAGCFIEFGSGRRGSDTVRLADITESFEQLGLTWDFKTLIRELEVLGLALSSSDADDAISPEGVLTMSSGSYVLAEVLAEVWPMATARRIALPLVCRQVCRRLGQTRQFSAELGRLCIPCKQVQWSR